MNDLLNIENKIRIIRGQQVMLDRNLAELYGVETKRLNEAVKRNIERFPADFCFQLTENEYSFLRSQIATSKTGETRGGRQYLPYVFTEQGVAMLASVVRTEVAAEISVQIMRTFVSMRHYLYDNQDIYRTLNYINNKMIEHDEKLDKLFSYFKKKKKYIHNSAKQLLSQCVSEKKLHISSY